MAIPTTPTTRAPVSLTLRASRQRHGPTTGPTNQPTNQPTYRIQLTAAGEAAIAAFQHEMGRLLKICLEREEPPPPDDFSISAQLWRVYQEYGPRNAEGGGARKGGGGGAVAASGGGGGGGSGGGELPLVSPPSRLEALRLRLRELVHSLRGTAPGAPGRGWLGSRSGEDGVMSAERILSEIGILFVEVGEGSCLWRWVRGLVCGGG